YYTNTAIPHSVSEIYTINYYDNYTFDKVSGNSETSYGKTPTTNVKGLTTGSKVRVLDSNPVKWITSVSYYDDKARPIYIYSHNAYLNTTDKIKSQLDFTGQVLETTTTHAKTGKSTITTVETFTYDHVGRLVSQKQKINSLADELIVENNYDDLGQLESKYVGGKATIDGYKDLVRVTLSNNELIKTTSTGWNGGLATKGSFSNNGYIEYEAPQNNKTFMVGLSSDNSSASYNSIDYALYTHSNNNVYVYESGSYKGYFGSYQAEDIFRVERTGSTIKYSKNGIVFYTSTSSSSGTLIGDGSIYSNQGKIKSLKIVNTSKGLQTVDYAYNIRGWLKQINNTASLGNDLFGFKINYNTVNHSATKLYNGNISETEWKTANDNALRWYKYNYDGLNRIESAYSYNGNYDVSNIAYDKNGNIQNLTRDGWQNSSNYQNMDVLNYDYFNSEKSNKLYKVHNAGNNNYGFKDSSVNDQDYWYDANGNMYRDDNKGITNITYNHLNLPVSVSINKGGNVGTISYFYDATGVKLKKVVSGTDSGTTEYAGNYVYEGSSLKFFNHAEGYVDISNGYEYVYQYKDHLGNVRLSYKDSNNNGSVTSSEILEENNYYPFGLKHKGYNNNPVTNHKYELYNGVEYEEALGLDLYEMPLRSYDPAIARWTTIDPVIHYFQSTYTGYNNNPVFWSDPSGSAVEKINGGVRYTEEHAKLAFAALKKQYGNNNSNKSGDKLELGTVILPEVTITVGDENSTKLAAIRTAYNIRNSEYYSFENQNTNGHFLLKGAQVQSPTEGFLAKALFHNGQMEYNGLSYSIGYDGKVIGLAPMAGTVPVGGPVKSGRGLWRLSKTGASQIKSHKTFGTMYKSKSDGLWWAIDRAGHGGSKFKVFKESKKGLEWFKDADGFGDFIINKHKGGIGKLIPWGQLKTVK
ncbi:RHS repeat-associated core domain-containing protein, partial [Postechiella marina]|uniref:RHS repeat domain-containing protein n=1 Tax=Postechiella marina TaxID=943941 RepID=UPI0031D09D18